MLKILIAVAGAALLAAPSLHAQDRHGFAGGQHIDRGGYNRGGYYGRGHYYYFGGVPYFYGLGFGDPYYYGLGYNVPYYGYGYPYPGGPYEGRVVVGNAQGESSLPSEVQQLLAKRGYYKGKVDGQFGPASRSALSRFQHDNGLKETGRIDEVSLQALGFSDHP